MSERKVKVKFEGKDMDVWDVPIEESIERWTELRLEDGAVLRVKVVVSNVFRLLDKDEQGNPISLSLFMEFRDLNDPGIQIEPPVLPSAGS